MKNFNVVVICLLITISLTFAENLALKLDGDGDCVTLPRIPQLTSYTVSFWFSPAETRDSSAVDRQTLYEADGQQPDTYIQLNDDGRLRCRDYITPINHLYSHTERWIADTWYHVAVTYDSSSRIKNLYVNGVEKSTDTLTVDLALNTEDSHTIGRYSFGESQYFNGKIDEIRVWNYARPQEEILVDLHTLLSGAETGLICYYPFDDGSADDQTGNGYNGVLMGDAFVVAADRINSQDPCLELDGDGDYLVLPQIPKLSAYTISLMFAPKTTWDSSMTDRQMLYEATGMNPDTYLQLYDNGRARYRTFITPINDVYTLTNQWSQSAWYHIAVTWDSSTHIKSIYTNGVEKWQDTLKIDLSLNTDESHAIGRYTIDNAQYFNGKIDQVRIWNYTRPQEEILRDMHAILTGREEGLVAYWNFDDGTAGDVTGNGYDGLLMGDAKIGTQTPVWSKQDFSETPARFFLEQNFPNPFNHATFIIYSIPRSDVVTLKIFDLLGKEVITLVDEYKKQGHYTINYNAKNLATGLYFYILESGSFVQSKKMLLIK